MQLRRSVATTLTLLLLVGCSSALSDNDNDGGSSSSEQPSRSSVPEPSESVSVDPTLTPLPKPRQPSTSMEVLPTTRGAANSGANDYTITNEQAVNYITWVMKDVDQVWSTWMVGRGYREPYVQYNIIQPGNPAVTQTCKVDDPRTRTQTLTIDSAFPNAFYCGSEPNGTDNGVILLPIETMMKTWSGDIITNPVSDPTKVGDFAAATVVSHEFGHHVQDEMSIQTGVAGPQGKNAELLADCFAGVWTTALYKEGGLEEGDIDEAIQALRAIGDKNPNGKFPHGTADERDNAFRIGIYGVQTDPRGGVPANCVHAFWPAFTGPM
jgi:hypothetical protein